MVSSTQKSMYLDVFITPSISLSERDNSCFFFRAGTVTEVTVDRYRTHTQGRRATKRQRQTHHDGLGFFRDIFAVLKLQTMPFVQEATTVNLLCVALHLHTVRLLTEGDDTRDCGDTIGPPEDEQRAARNMLRSVM